MTPPRTRRHRLACAMITAALAAASDRCSKIPPGLGHPPVNLTPVTLQVLQPSIEPVPVPNTPRAASVTARLPRASLRDKI